MSRYFFGYVNFTGMLGVPISKCLFLWRFFDTIYNNFGGYSRSNQLDQAIGDSSNSLGRSGRGGLACSASLQLPIRTFWTCSKNLSRDREAKRSRSHQEMIGYWLSSGRVDRKTIV